MSPILHQSCKMRKQENRPALNGASSTTGGQLWKDGLICAFEYVNGGSGTVHSKSRSSKLHSRFRVPKQQESACEQASSVRNEPNLADSAPLVLESAVPVKDTTTSTEAQPVGCLHGNDDHPRRYWTPIGWSRIAELVQTVQIDGEWASQPNILLSEDDEDGATIEDLAAPYWERPVGPTWWCHVQADHPSVISWLHNAHWLHPAITIALLDERRLISERMKHLLYEVPVRVAGGLVFELLGQSAGDPFHDEDDIPVVLRSWHQQNFLITSLHVKGSAANINVLGIMEVQEMLTGFANIPRTVHELIAHLACRLARWDDRLFRKSIFGAADEVELKFMNRRTREDLQLFTIILNHEIKKLSSQVIRVKWSLHAREEIVFELLQHLKGNATRSLLESIRKSTREMIEEQEAVRARLFTIQDVMQSTVRAWLQDRSLTVSHNLGVFGGCGLILSIITGLFGINVDGIPGEESCPYAFAVFTGGLLLLGAFLIGVGLVYLGLEKPKTEEEVGVRSLELQELVKMFQQEAESHAQVRKTVAPTFKPSSAEHIIPGNGGYVLIR